MWKVLAGVGAVLIVAGIIIASLYGSAVFSSQIQSSKFHSHGHGEFVSDEISLWLTSYGMIYWNSGAMNPPYYLVKAATLNSVNESNVANYAIPPIMNALGTSTYGYEGLLGSYYVVAFAGSNPSYNISITFERSLTSGGQAIQTPNGMIAAQEIFISSVLTIIIGIAIIGLPPFFEKLRDAGRNGISPALYLRQRLRNMGSGIRALRRRAKVGIAISVIVLVAIALTLASYTTSPRVISGISPSSFQFAFVENSTYSSTIINMSYLGFSSTYLVALNGPVPKTGGVNSSQLYNYFYTMEFVKISKNTAGPYFAQTPVVDSASVRIGIHTFPVNVSLFTVFTTYGGLFPIEVGRNGAGSPPPNTLLVELTSELSANLPNGNYTMYASVTVSPVNVIGPYHLKGPAQTVVMTIPIWINNSVQPIPLTSHGLQR